MLHHQKNREMKVYLRQRKGQLSNSNKQKGRVRMNTFYLIEIKSLYQT